MRKDGVIQIVEAYDRAWSRKDFAAVDRILANNYVYFTSEGGIVSRRDTLNFLRSPKYILNSAERSELVIDAHGHRRGDRARYETVALQSAQSKRKHPLRYTANVTLHFSKTHRTAP